MFDLLIFDLDGTLAYTKDDILASAQFMLKEIGLPRQEEEDILNCVGHGLAYLIRGIIGDDPDPDYVENARKIFYSHYSGHLLENTRLRPWTLEFLNRFPHASKAVLTNKILEHAMTILEGLKISDYFEFIYGGDTFPEFKPSPLGVFKIMELTDIPASRTVIIGDSDVDIKTGKNAGIYTCGIRGGGICKDEVLAAENPDWLVNSLEEFFEIIDKSS